MKKSELRELIKEELLNEATYVKGKVDNIISSAQGNFLNDFIHNLKLTVSNSPDFKDTKVDSKAAIKDIDAAYKDFIKNLKLAVKPVAKNYTGT